ncbi:MAG: metallophosphoesterase [Firmicutes bacterium HGW-Firmicutes-14]|nr:MAG: metallophosphoesterase [Firmicutes bacterium HGW-Firmicutes-14]
MMNMRYFIKAALILRKTVWFIVRSLLTTAVVMGLIFTYAYKLEPAWTEVREQKVYLEGLPEAFEGFRIVQISDLHGRHFPDKKLVRQVNRLEPDIIAITGDVLDDDPEVPLEYLESALGGISARYGSFFVFGNNDSYPGKELVSRRLEELGIKVLINGNRPISLEGGNLWLAGVDDPRDGKPFLSRALEGVGEGPVILLAHSPEIIDSAADAGFDLVLVGHTHGGQILLPKVPRVITFVRKGYERYVSGLYTVGNTQMYVTRGLGMTKIPMRFWARPEISVITLYPK